nr:mismatch repair and meiotic recombination protein [Pseudozyma thailandica]
MVAIERLPDVTAASIQASLLAVTVEDICRILFRHATERSESIFGTASGRTTILIDYATWTINVAHEVDNSNILASTPGAHGDLAADDQIELLSYLGLLHITSTSSAGASAQIWQEGRKIDSTLPATPPPSHSGAAVRGITASLRDVFSGMPVRRKFIASEAPKRSQSDSLVRCVRELSLLLADASIQLSIRQSPRSDGAMPSSRTLLNLPRARSLIHRCVAAFGADTIDLVGVRNIATKRRFTTGTIEVHGFVCSTATNSPPQYIFLQGRAWPDPTTRANVHNLHRDSAVFAAMLARHGLSWKDGESQMHTRGEALSPELYELVTNRIAALAGASLTDKGLAYSFVLIISLSCEGQNDSAQRSSRPTLNATSFEQTLLDAICAEPASTASESPRKRRRSNRHVTTREANDEVPCVTGSSRPSTATLARESYGLGSEVPEGFIEWKNPMNGRLFHIDRRTGHSLAVSPVKARLVSGESRPSTAQHGAIVDRSNLRTGLGYSISRPATSECNGSADEFDDPILDAALASIASPSPATPVSTPRRKSRFFDSRRPDSNFNISNFGEDAYNEDRRPKTGDLELAISRELLQRASVLAQVDDKFIFCAASPLASSNPVLFCIDQHAADERVRLERMIEDFVTDCVNGHAAHALGRTLTLGITRKEFEGLDGNSKIREEMRKLGWGVERVVMVHEALGHAQVDLRGIPHILRERVLSDTARLKDEELLLKVLKNCVEELADASHLAIASTATTTASIDWLALSRSLPTSLMDVMKNKACRSAIMFNDPLSKEASERLVRRLGECKFPFMCAHGRPSLVPLCEIMTIANGPHEDDG